MITSMCLAQLLRKNRSLSIQPRPIKNLSCLPEGRECRGSPLTSEFDVALLIQKDAVMERGELGPLSYGSLVGSVDTTKWWGLAQPREGEPPISI